jgi:hypothetical protein
MGIRDAKEISQSVLSAFLQTDGRNESMLLLLPQEKSRRSGLVKIFLDSEDSRGVICGSQPNLIDKA